MFKKFIISLLFISVIVASSLSTNEEYCKNNATYPHVLSYSLQLSGEKWSSSPLIRGQTGYVQMTATFSDAVPYDWYPAVKYQIDCNIIDENISSGIVGLQPVSECTNSFCELFSNSAVSYDQTDQFQVPIESNVCDTSASLIWIEQFSNTYCPGWETQNGTVDMIGSPTYNVIDAYAYELQNQLNATQTELQDLKNQHAWDIVNNFLFPFSISLMVLLLAWFGRKKIEPVLASWLERGVIYKDQNLSRSILGPVLECTPEKLKDKNGKIVKVTLEKVEFVKHSNPSRNFFNMKPKQLPNNFILRMGGIQTDFFVGRYKSDTVSNNLKFTKVEFILEIREIRNGFIEAVLIEGKDLIGDGGRGA